MLLSRPTLFALLSSFFVFGVLFPPALQASNAVLNLGTVAVGASTTASFSIPLSTAPSGVTLALHYGTDFTIGTCVASGSSCNVSVTFSPTHAGLRQDAIIVKNSAGSELAEGFLYGTGRGPQVTFSPGVLNVLYTGVSHMQPGDYFTSLACDQAGNLYLSKGNFNVILKFAPGSSTPVIIAGQTLVSGTSGDGGPATSALLTYPRNLTLDGAGNLYFADGIDNYAGLVIRKIDAATGIISRVAGQPTFGSAPVDGSLATSGALSSIASLATNRQGDLYLATKSLFGSPEIRIIDATTDVITTVAGGTSPTTSGDGGPASAATFSQINGLAFDSAGNLFVADFFYIRRIDAGTHTISSIAGTGTSGTITSGSPAANAPIANATNLVIDSLNNLYFIQSSGNDGIYKIDPATGILTAFAGGSYMIYQGIQNGDLSDVDDFVFTSFQGNNLAFDASGNYYVASNSAFSTLPQLIAVNTTSPAYGFLTSGTFTTNPSPLTVSLNNIGNQNLVVASENVTGSFSTGTPATSPCAFPGSLAADSSCSLTLNVIPDAGYANGTLSFIDNSLNQQNVTQQASLSFLYPSVTASPAQVNLASGVVGAPSFTSVDFTNSSTVPFVFDHATVTGPNAADFTVSTCYGVYTALLQGQDCSINITFTPSAAGTRTATLTEYGNNQTPISVPLSGSALLPMLSLSSTSLTFTQSQWNTTVTQVVALSNIGQTTITFPSRYAPGLNNFYVEDQCALLYYSQGLPPGHSCQILFSFHPYGQVGQFSSSYTLSTSVPGPQPVINLNATVAVTGPALTLSQATLSFTSPVNKTSAAVPLALKNQGAAAATITSVTLTGSQASDFQQFNNCPASLPAGESCIIWVSYSPVSTSPQSSSATLNISGSGAFNHSEPLNGSLVEDSVARVVIESPASGLTPVSGTITLSGWAGQDQADLGNVQIAIDNVLINQAYLNVPRADVCQVFPDLADCPNPGWLSSLDTTLFADGIHTLSILAGQPTGANAATVQFLIQNGSRSGVPNLNIESPLPSQILSGTVNISGWAYRSSEFTTVVISVDGVRVSPVQYSARPDVCNAYNDPQLLGDCSESGWTASLNVSDLAPGSHTLTVTATGSNGAVALKSQTFTTQAESGPIAINVEQPAANQVVAHTLNASGWAVTSGASISNVQAYMDGQIVGGLGITVSRPDVCAAFPGSTGCPNVGWSGQVTLPATATGTHTIVFTVTASDGTVATFNRLVNIVDIVTPATDQFLLNIESPAANATLSGVTAVSGWVVDGLTMYPEIDLAVDGLPVATTFSYSYRADVCAAYPWAASCDEGFGANGWQTSIDTTLLSDGAHTLSAAATSSIGKRVIKSFTFTSNNSAARATNGQIINIESPAANQQLSAALSIVGWAVSKSSPVTEVDILIDGIPMGAAQYGFARPDVCAAYPASVNCPNVGWSFILDTRTLADGMHTVEAVEQTASGSASVTHRFAISNAGLATPIHAFIESPGVNATVSGTAPLTGWAIDDSAAIASIAVTVDDLPQEPFATYGVARPDVCAAFPGRAGCPNVGWTSSIDTTQFPNGSHTVAVIVKSASGDVLTLSRVIQTAN
jgi:hypothetical protein